MTKQTEVVQKILLIMPDDMVSKYKRRFLHEGFICKAVDNGFYALTMLEREKPSLIIATEDIEDLELEDLLEVIEIDPDLAATRMIVLSEDLNTLNSERCQTISKDSSFEDALATANQLLNREAEGTIADSDIEGVSLFDDLAENLTSENTDELASENSVDELEDISLSDDTNVTPVTPIAPNHSVATNSIENQIKDVSFDDDNETIGNVDTIGDDVPADTRYDTSDAQITGELATDQLIDLIKTFSMGSRGLLIIRTSKADGRLLLEQERLLKAEYNYAAGKEAFDALLYDALNEPKASYFFKRYDNASSNNGSKGKGVALSYLLKNTGNLVEST